MKIAILTLCEDCAALYMPGYRVTQLAHKTTTETKKACEHCGKEYRIGLKQYKIESKKHEKGKVC